MANYEVKEYTVKDILEKISNDQIKLPKFQRGIVWNKEKRNKFLISLRNGDPIGIILLSKNNKNEYTLIDGLQRITTIYEDNQNSCKKLINTLDNDEDLLKKMISLFVGEATNGDLAIKKQRETFKKDLFKKINEEFIKINVANNNLEKQNIEKILYDIYSENNVGTFDWKIKNKIDYLVNVIFIKNSLIDHKIPAIIYDESKENSDLATVFERLNTGGVSLSKYEIAAAKWDKFKLKITNESQDITDAILNKYNGMKEKGIDVNFDEQEIKKEITLFEYCFALSKILTNKFTNLFGKNNKEKIHPIGFEILSLIFQEKFLRKFDDITNYLNLNEKKNTNQYNFLIDLKNKIIFIFDDISKMIENINLKTKLNDEQQNLYFELNNNYQIYHIFMFIWKNKFEIDRRDNNEFKIILKKIKDKNYRKTLPLHYFIDYFTDFWSKNRQISSLENLIKEDAKLNKYSIFIKTEEIKEKLKEEILLINKENKKTIPNKYKVFLSFIHNLNYKINIDYKNYINKNNELEGTMDIHHIIPKDDLKSIADKIAVSSLGNLTYIWKKTNRSIKSKTLEESKYPETQINKLWKQWVAYPDEITQQVIKTELSKENKINKYETFYYEREDKIINNFIELINKEYYKEYYKEYNY